MIYKPKHKEEKGLPFHKKGAPGLKFLLANSDIFPDSEVYIALRRIKELEPERAKDYIIPHKHNVDSYFLFFGENEDLSGLEVEVMNNNERLIVRSPASIYIPVGTEHWHKPVSGSGYLMTIVLKGNYKESVK